MNLFDCSHYNLNCDMSLRMYTVYCVFNFHSYSHKERRKEIRNVSKYIFNSLVRIGAVIIMKKIPNSLTSKYSCIT